MCILARRDDKSPFWVVMARKSFDGLYASSPSPSSCQTGVRCPLVAECNTLEHLARNIHKLPTSPKLIQPRAGGITRKRQQQIQNVFAESVNIFPRGQPDWVKKGHESMSDDHT